VTVIRSPLPAKATTISLAASKRQPRRFQAERILRISRVVSDLARAEAFYRDALGFFAIGRGPVDTMALAALDAPDTAEEVVMQSGAQCISLVSFAAAGLPYPSNSRSDDLWFQHMAIVVGDMDAAFTHLSSCEGWSPISENGPQLLPPSNGGVRAFKFRDPDGHPLELIWFPHGQARGVWHAIDTGALFLGIDHSGLSVASTQRSLRFYRGLGLRVSDRSLNHGAAQTRLDGLAGTRVRVTGLRPASDIGPGLELLGYRPPGRPAGMTSANDVLTDWITLAVSPSPDNLPCAVRDPDGHRLILVDHGEDVTGLPA